MAIAQKVGGHPPLEIRCRKCGALMGHLIHGELLPALRLLLGRLLAAKDAAAPPIYCVPCSDALYGDKPASVKGEWADARD